MLTDILKNKKCFKLICGAGNEDAVEVEKLVYLYSRAGCNVFDLSANIEVIEAAKRGLERAGITQNRFLCVSVGIKGDPHTNKAQIDEKLCKKCDICKKICPQQAIEEYIHTNYVKRKKCIGCGRCLKVCPHSAIELVSENKDLRKIMPSVIEKGVDCLEYHAIIEDDAEVFDKWEYLNSIYNGFLSICIDRSKLSNEKLISRISKMIKNRKPYTTIIQADGAPMSGGEDDYKTTLQAVAMAEIIMNANLPVYLLLSGGTNSKSAELAKLCGIDISGVAIGSYARKIVKDYISRDDFFENESIINEALIKAKELVRSVITE